MKHKIVSILVCMLLFVTVSSVTGTINIEKSVLSLSEPNPVTTAVIWSDNFDNYTIGPLHGQGGWEAWDNNPATTGYVTDNQSRSPENSAEIAWFGGVSADIVYQFSGVNSGLVNLTVYQYVPSDMEGNSYYLLLDDYHHGGPYAWSLQLEVSATKGTIADFDDPSTYLTLITDTWVEIRVEIDFEDYVQTVYYDGEELLSKDWGANKNLACIDLYADQTFSTSVYYDNFRLEGEVSEEPDLKCGDSLNWENVTAGSTQTGNFEVENVGSGLLGWSIVKKPSWGEWTFDPDGGDNLAPGAPQTVQVTVIAPGEKNQQYSGQIKIQNKDNPDDYCTIDVRLSTPMSKQSVFLHFFEKLMQRFPALELIFSHMLG